MAQMLIIHANHRHSPAALSQLRETGLPDSLSHMRRLRSARPALGRIATACRATIEASIMRRYIADFGVRRARPNQDHLRLPPSGQISERMK
ncbi:hypothetical protein C1D09_022450 [Mesorhizobium intechi]|uniref:Uncharacterized protein n=1 Tax=Mesorhizobium intechi TaxID=537601 RepID=A0A8T9ALF0_9HYPH|nr:hypothetical protein [Mesorhizobium intechi]TSE05449.1 hypothetical protein C1D09_022450 [Mesorhizobium intechi]